LLFRIDPQPYEIAVAQAQAHLNATRLQVEGLKATYRQQMAALQSSRDTADFNTSDFNRKSALLASDVTSRATYEQAETALKVSRQGIASAQQQVANTVAALDGNPGIAPAQHPAVREAQAQLDKAKLDLAYTRVTAPEDGVVLTEDPAGLLDRQMASGETLLSLAGNAAGGADGERLRKTVRLFLPAGALNRVQPGAEVGLDVPGRFSILRLRLGPVDGEAVALPPGLVPHQDYKGVTLPVLYSSRMNLPESAGDLPLGIAGLAKVYGPRRSLAGRMVNVALNLMRAHFW